MTQRIIPIYPKTTSANTQYWEIQAEDRAWILEQFVDFMGEMQEISTHDEDLRREWFRRRPGLYPRGKNGPNSHASMLGGMTRALFAGHDITTPQLDAVEHLVMLIRDYRGSGEGVHFRREFWTRG